jgi:hypothetical protein
MLAAASQELLDEPHVLTNPGETLPEPVPEDEFSVEAYPSLVNFLIIARVTFIDLFHSLHHITCC